MAFRVVPMLRIHFTAEDLAKTRLLTTYGPIAEAMFSVGALRSRPDVMFNGWRRQLGAGRYRWAGQLGAVIGNPPVLDLFTLIGPTSSSKEGSVALLSTPPRALRAEVDAAARHVRRFPDISPIGPAAVDWISRLPTDHEARTSLAIALHRCYTTAVEPYWEAIRAHLDAETAVRTRDLVTGGVAHLLSNLGPQLQWCEGALEIPLGRPVEVHLRGRGLVIVPAVFCRKVAGPYVSLVDHDTPAVLFYPALRELPDALHLWAPAADRSNGRNAALPGLIGATRAAALRIISNGCTTTELARRLRVSAATASYHASVLRDAKLITTRRHGSAVLHTIKPLGAALLDGDTNL